MMLKLKLQSLATSCEELTHWKRLWCWEGLGAGGEGDDRGWDGWMASPTWWAWVWVNSGSWWWTGRPGVLRFMGSQKVGHDWAELNWRSCKGARSNIPILFYSNYLCQFCWDIKDIWPCVIKGYNVLICTFLYYKMITTKVSLTSASYHLLIISFHPLSNFQEYIYSDHLPLFVRSAAELYEFFFFFFSHTV